MKWHCGCSFRLGLRDLVLRLALLIAFHASAGHNATHGEGEVATPTTGQENQ